MDHARRGADALSASDASTAVLEYTKALIDHPTSPDYFTQRSTAFTRLKPPRHDLALKDAEYAVLCAQRRQKRDKIQAAQQRRVIALHGAGRYRDAGFVLEKMERFRLKDNKKDKMENDMWRAKIDQNIRRLPDIHQQAPVTVTEYPQMALPDESTIKSMLHGQLKSDGTFNFNGEDDQVLADEDVDMPHSAVDGPTGGVSTNGASSTTLTTSTPSSGPKLTEIRHEWFQNTQSVIVTLYAKSVPKDKAEITIQDDNIDVSFPHPSDPSSTYQYSIEPLYALIDPYASQYKVMSTKVEITLCKKVAGQRWPSLEGTTPLKAANAETDPSAKAAIMSTLQQPPTINTAPSYPTSSRTGPKNWDKLATDLTAKKKKAINEDKENGSDSDVEAADYDSDDGPDPVDGFFKKLYKGADDDTKRAMMKSYQESGGTALSTNWSEVGKGRVEPVKSRDED